jgi:hypothetical protein
MDEYKEYYYAAMPLVKHIPIGKYVVRKWYFLQHMNELADTHLSCSLLYRLCSTVEIQNFSVRTKTKQAVKFQNKL